MTLRSISADIAFAVRLARKQPVMTTAAVLALATGIGLATMGFTFLDAGLNARLPFAGGDRFVIIDVFEEPEARRATLATDRFQSLRAGAPALAHLGALEGAAQNLRLPSGEVVLLRGIAITPDSFAVLPYAPLFGRPLIVGDALPGAPPTVVIRERVWRHYFGSDPAAVGQTANFSGVMRTIVGVMPDDFEFPNSPEVWLPLTDTSRARIFGVLESGRSVTLAEAQLQTVSRQFESADHGAPRLRLEVLPFIEAQSRGLDILAATVVFVLVLVLLVIAANVANLVLARTLARSAELAVRSALGATRARLVAQVFIEVLVLGTMAAGIGLTASNTAFAWIRETLTDMPFWVDLSPSPRTGLFVATVTILAAAVGGAWPALRATRRDTLQALHASSRRVAAGFGVAGSVMVALQVAVSIAALHSALVVARGVSGYMLGAGIPHEDNVVTARVYVPDEVDVARAHAEVHKAVQQLRDVTHAGLATSLPRLSPPTMMTTVRRDGSTAASVPRAAPVVAVSPGFIETLSAGPISGRLFDSRDLAASAPPVAIVNEPFVQKYFGGANAIGQQVGILDADASPTSQVWRQIVGVVPDLGLSLGDDALAAGVYVPLQDQRVTYLAVTTRGDSAHTALALRRVVADADPRIQVQEVLPLPDVGKEDRAVFAGIGTALTGLGAVALGLSVIGVYAMLSFAVTARTREIAIRCALGAARHQVLASVLARVGIPLVLGAVAGPLLSSALISARGIFVFRLPAEAAPAAGPILVAIMLVAALSAAFLPARRALRVNPAEALRAD